MIMQFVKETREIERGRERKREIKIYREIHGEAEREEGLEK
jgi:hypothetical protein